MRMPGGNILNMAFSVISRQNFSYYAFRSRAVNSIGLDVSVYANAVATTGSVQPVSRTLYDSMGLDLQANYFNFFLEKGVIDVSRNVAGDQFAYDGKRFNCVSKTDWYGADGWDQVLAVEVVAP